MEFLVKSGNPEKQRTACVVVGVFEPRKLSPAGEELDAASGGFISNILRRGDLEGKVGQTRLLHQVPQLLADRVLLVGCGRERELDSKTYRRVHTIAARALNESGSTECVTYLTELNLRGRDFPWKIRQAIEAVEDCLYRFDQLKSRKDAPRRPLRKITLTVPSRRELAAGEEAVRVGMATASGVKLAKDLANLPGNICTPSYLAEQARALGKTYRHLQVEILEREHMESLGMGALLAVAQGSAQPPKLIVLRHRPDHCPEGRAPVVLVGKGITFDSGGISIKQAANMDEMKFDMGGAAAVFGAVSVAAELDLPLDLVGIVPAAENMPGSRAIKPGDIVTGLSGQTIEILNTDAEGRLVLSDALTYAERFEPDAVIDIATLTGACIVALGRLASGLMSNHGPLANELLAAARLSEDRLWELPLWEDYQEALESNFADMANVGQNREAGAIIGAAFLARFARKLRWAHLDIAGTAWLSGRDKGATGRPVPLLTQFLLDRVGAGHPG